MDRKKKWPLDILLAEDEASDVDLFTMALAERGELKSLTIVRDGQEAIEYLAGKPPWDKELRVLPNGIILDVNMPRRNGFEVLRWLKKRPEFAAIPAIVLSSSPLQQDVRRAYELGASAFLTKPHKFQDLVQLLDATFSLWGMNPLANLPSQRRPGQRR
jgi:CheY-like chemotaxis protein